MLDSNLITQQTKNWILSFIIPLQICPFASYVIDNQTIQFNVSNALTLEDALADLNREIDYLNHHQAIETSLVIFPNLFAEFFTYLDFIDLAEEQIIAANYEGIYQFATFHPNYCFADATGPEDVANYTNRSPHPMVHILREDSVEKAIAFYGNTEQIPANNIALLHSLGLEKIKALLSKVM
ncbi:Protein of uncharacterised function (DUF1415) [Legionella beliardensis]|uniref:Protein of uncharacterized function (DUF1415) n=1 Tax=Legionella beliardensis TaxID=91822 RepID=A0A378I5S8_9GAMM|nr:DUF1415 domain-containing protein [Legionella beliardensis]STX30011.1 Protein of uncharacterised function (DUF1415) [Legionella beliardensis]